MSLAGGARLGHYEIVAPLGAGGMGEVYRARDTRLARDVAIKVLPARLLENAEARTRFEREAKAVAALSHPNILAIHDFGEHEGAAYMGPSESDRTQTIALGESTEPGTVLGTVHYMAPEQVGAGAVDHRSDIFSFGIVLYEMLTGKRPFQAESAVETMNSILRDEPPDSSSVNPGVPLGVERILRRCLEK